MGKGDQGILAKVEGTHLLLSPFTTVTRIGDSLSLVGVDLGTSHGIIIKQESRLCTFFFAPELVV